MTFFEWIRKCLLWDAKKHPMPEEQKETVRRKIRRQAERKLIKSEKT